MKGFSMVELLVVMAIVGIVALFSVNSIISFQNQTVAENATQKILTQMRLAQSKSRSSELPAGTTVSTYAENGLPIYGIKLSGATLTLIHKDVLMAGTVEAEVVDETVPLDSTITTSIAPSGNTIFFNRLSGETDKQYTITIQKSGSTTRIIAVAINGTITVQ